MLNYRNRFRIILKNIMLVDLEDYYYRMYFEK